MLFENFKLKAWNDEVRVVLMLHAGVLLRFHGQVSEEFLPLLLHLESPALPGIVAALDVIKDIHSGLRSRPVVVAIHAFSFKDSEKALRGSVIGATAHRTHATGHLMRRQDRLGHCPRYWRSLPRETRCYHCHVPPVTVDEDLREMRRG